MFIKLITEGNIECVHNINDIVKFFPNTNTIILKSSSNRTPTKITEDSMKSLIELLTQEGLYK